MTARGLKRICTECNARFYDFNKSPIICPSCGAEYTGVVKVKSRRSRTANDTKAAVSPEADDTTKDNQVEAGADDNEDEDDESISLDDLSAEENSDDDSDDEGLDDADLDLDDLDNIDDMDDDDDDLDDLAVDVEGDDDR